MAYMVHDKLCNSYTKSPVDTTLLHKNKAIQDSLIDQSIRSCLYKQNFNIPNNMQQCIQYPIAYIAS